MGTSTQPHLTRLTRMFSSWESRSDCGEGGVAKYERLPRSMSWMFFETPYDAVGTDP